MALWWVHVLYMVVFTTANNLGTLMWDSGSRLAIYIYIYISYIYFMYCVYAYKYINVVWEQSQPKPSINNLIYCFFRWYRCNIYIYIVQKQKYIYIRQQKIAYIFILIFIYFLHHCCSIESFIVVLRAYVGRPVLSSHDTQ